MPDHGKMSANPRNSVPAFQIVCLSGTMLRLKSWLPDADRTTPVVLAGRQLQSEAGWVSHSPMHVLCVGPSEWLIVDFERDAPGLREVSSRDLSQQGLVVTDLMDGLAAFEVCGPASREMLAKGCGLDFHPRAFPAARCARTRFAQVPVIIESLDDAERLRLYVTRSYSNYLSSWITDAAAEYLDP